MRRRLSELAQLRSGRRSSAGARVRCLQLHVYYLIPVVHECYLQVQPFDPGPPDKALRVSTY